MSMKTFLISIHSIKRKKIVKNQFTTIIKTKLNKYNWVPHSYGVVGSFVEIKLKQKI